MSDLGIDLKLVAMCVLLTVVCTFTGCEVADNLPESRGATSTYSDLNGAVTDGTTDLATSKRDYRKRSRSWRR